MAMQVVTPENFQQLIETGKVDAFKPPEAAKPVEKSEKVAEAAETAKTLERDADGKFTKPSESDTSTRAGAKPEEDEGGDDLPEHARKVIGKKHRLMKEAEEFAREQWRAKTAAEQRAEKAERENAELKNTKPGPVPEKGKEPVPEDFKTVAEYSRALAKFWAAEEIQAERDKAEQQRQSAIKAERERAYAKRIDAAREKYDDFEEVIKSLSGTESDQVPMDVAEYIQESEFGAELLYHFAKHPDERDRLRKLSPRRFIAELGKLETKWEKQPETAAKLSEVAATAPVPAVSKAPAPIQVLDGKSATVEKDPSKMSFQELREYERKRESEKRARR